MKDPNSLNRDIEKISDCCKSTMTVQGDETHYYTCDKCGKPCDVSPNWITTKPNGWEQEVYQWFHDQDIRIHSDRVQPLLETISQAILSAEERGREEGIRECIEALPKKIQVKLEEPVLRQYDPTPNACGGYSSVPFYCSLCGMGEMDIQDNKIDGAYHCACSIWTNSCGGKWVQWLDKEKAQKMAEELPSEDNFFNQAIDQATKALLSLPDQDQLSNSKTE